MQRLLAPELKKGSAAAEKQASLADGSPFGESDWLVFVAVSGTVIQDP